MRLQLLQQATQSGRRISDVATLADDELRQLAKLPKLRELWLGDTEVSDAGLAHLRSLKTLTVLEVSQTKVTAEGLRRLKQLLPRLK